MARREGGGARRDRDHPRHGRRHRAWPAVRDAADQLRLRRPPLRPLPGFLPKPPLGVCRGRRRGPAIPTPEGSTAGIDPQPKPRPRQPAPWRHRGRLQPPGFRFLGRRVRPGRPQQPPARTAPGVDDWRNAIAHQDFDAVAPGGVPTLHLGTVRGWRSAINALARSFDVAMYNYLVPLVGAPW